MKPTYSLPIPSNRLGSRYCRPVLLAEKEACEHLDLANGTLRAWRCSKAAKRQIPYLKIGANVRYRLQDLDAWLEQQLITPEGWNAADNLLQQGEV